ncbi:hypothetical protein PT2222_360001 [Paraburkholderia tropica]
MNDGRVAAVTEVADPVALASFTRCVPAKRSREGIDVVAAAGRVKSDLPNRIEWSAQASGMASATHAPCQTLNDDDGLGASHRGEAL